MEDASNAPKFHMDRSKYRDGLLQWFINAHPNHSNIAVTDIDIPVATGFSNETVFFGVSSNSDEGSHEGRYVARIEPEDGGIAVPDGSDGITRYPQDGSGNFISADDLEGSDCVNNKGDENGGN